MPTIAASTTPDYAGDTVFDGRLLQHDKTKTASTTAPTAASIPMEVDRRHIGTRDSRLSVAAGQFFRIVVVAADLLLKRATCTTCTTNSVVWEIWKATSPPSTAICTATAATRASAVPPCSSIRSVMSNLTAKATTHTRRFNASTALRATTIPAKCLRTGRSG